MLPIQEQFWLSFFFLGEHSGISYCFSGTLVQLTLHTKEIVPFRLG